MRRADGVYRWLLASGLPKHATDGSFLGYVGCDFDITERKEAEALIEKSHREIQQLAGRLLSAHEDERRRLARELHDDLTQRLARLAIDAGGLEQRDGRDGTVVTFIREELVRLSDDVHAMSYRLHPSVLDDLGLVEALKTECDRVARKGSLRVEVDANGVPAALPAEASLCLFRVAQEALSNASRHARASAVTVLLTPRDQRPRARGSRRRRRLRSGELARPREPRPRQHARKGAPAARQARNRQRARAGHERCRVGAGGRRRSMNRPRVLLADDHRMWPRA